MNFFKRAVLSVWKHRVKSLLLILAFGLIGTMLFTGLAIRSAASSVQARMMKDVNSKVIVRTGDNGISASQLEQLKNLPHVSGYNCIASERGDGVDFRTFINEDVRKRVEQSVNQSTTEYQIDMENNCVITDVEDSAKLDEFVTGTYKIVEGRPITTADYGKKVTMISQKLADYNHLHVNDTITFRSEFYSDASYSFQIVGIFTTPPPPNLNAYGYADFNPYDQIYMPFGHQSFGLKKNMKVSPENSNYFYFYLNSPTNLNSFIAAAILIRSDSNLYQRITAPIRGAAMLTTLMVVILLAAGCLILALLVALSLRGRRREFGILLAIGERKWKILLQMFMETLLPVLIAFCIAVFASFFVSQKMGDVFLDKGTSIAQKQDAKNAFSGGEQNIAAMAQESSDNTVGFFDSTNASVLNKLSVSVTPGDVGLFAGCGLLIVLVSVLVPVVSVIRLSPIAVLTKKE